MPRLDGGAPLPARPLFSEMLPATNQAHFARILVQDGMKMIQRVDERRFELYDLAKDPAEKHNLVDDPGRAQIVAQMKARLLQFAEGRR